MGPGGKVGDQADMPEDDQYPERHRGDHIAQRPRRQARPGTPPLTMGRAAGPGRGSLAGLTGVEPPVSTRAT